jgi:hypothetical protein
MGKGLTAAGATNMFDAGMGSRMEVIKEVTGRNIMEKSWHL